MSYFNIQYILHAWLHTQMIYTHWYHSTRHTLIPQYAAQQKNKESYENEISTKHMKGIAGSMADQLCNKLMIIMLIHSFSILQSPASHSLPEKLLPMAQGPDLV